ncbi:MAG: N-6 DNA methylase [Fibromonadaceae bacterium]|jgi:type I restriction enzyme M protein|nr:N-6 DNA methylase [Fibromonadaceae bacterium]
MDYKCFLKALGFASKENAIGVFAKKYPKANDYCLEVDVEKESINYGNEIKAESRTTQNFSQPENFVVLECVNRLLEKGYKPENIILEKTYPLGHGSGRLDILVTREDGTAYLMIECKTYGKEFDKELKNTQNNGGQLFSYFQQNTKTELLMLYASEIKGHDIAYRNEIIKIEDDYRVGDVNDFYEKWNKLTKDNGVFDTWVKPYNFKSKVLTPKQLIPIRQEDSSLIFNQFLEILRHNVVSDKPNAFNKIFTLFLCKVYDEKSTKDNKELQFQWFDGIDKTTGDDAYVDFLIRLSDLYKNGMSEFLEKKVTDFSEDEFKQKYGKIIDENIKKNLLRDFKKIRLEKNNEFAIKEVFDNQSFLENSKIVKEVVELLQGYRLRYNKRQQYLSDFFELLLTTGLKQESGQFFTPVPIAQFIIKSLPMDKFVNEKLEKGENNNLLPFIIDYAAGSGHFLTESMHEIQRLIDQKTSDNYIPDTANKIKSWQNAHFDWATQYVYGIEKDYRLVKVGKVGCYLHGDGLANVILSDGLANFKNPEYKEKLRIQDKDFPKENKQFDIVISNPPYSVSAFRNTARDYYTEEDFELYNELTDSSSEIECLFIERTKQLLKDGGVAGIILPSSILNNEGIYTKAREIILKYFEIVAITELGSNTFMATSTNTVVLFIRRRNNYDCKNFAASLENSLKIYQDNTINGIEKPIAKYVNHVWENISFKDYITLLKKDPNENIKSHEIYKEYGKKIKFKTEKDFLDKLVEIEKEKLLYFILAYPQKVVLIKTGNKDAEKRFLGYEFSNRRGSEGIHPIQRGKTIDECTKLFDDEHFDNEEKASTYIYKAFIGDYKTPIHENLKNNISRVRLVDMLTFDRAGFAKNISTAVKKKVKIESKYEQVLFTNAIKNVNGSVEKIEKFNIKKTGKYPVVTQEKENLISGYSDDKNPVSDLPILLFGDHSCTLKYLDFKFFRGADGTVLLKPQDKFIVKYFYNVLQYSILELIENREKYERHYKYLQKLYIPLPPKEIQEKIVSEIEVLEKKEVAVKREIENWEKKIEQFFTEAHNKANITFRLSDNIFDISIGKRVIEADLNINGTIPVYSANVFEPFGYIDKYLINDFSIPSVLWGIDGDWMVNYIPADKPFYPTDHCGVLRIKTNDILPKYLAWILNKKGIAKNFSRTLRASIDRIKGISIKVPSFSQQQKIVSKIEKIESQIVKVQKITEKIPILKKNILKKYGIY